MLERWTAVLPDIHAVDTARARDHEQAISDLEQLIASLDTDRTDDYA